MSIRAILIEMAIFAALFTAGVLASYRGDGKYKPGSIHNYPPDIQEEYFKTHERVDVTYRSKSVVLSKSLGVLLFGVIIVVCALAAGAKTFWQGFGLAFGLMVWIGAFDTFFLDWVVFANLPAARLEGTEHMDEAYHQKWFHVRGILFPGILFALIVAVLVGSVIAVIR